MSTPLSIFKHKSGFSLELGGMLTSFQLGYRLIGNLNSQKSNLVLLHPCIGIPPNPMSWWRHMIGPGRAIDTDRFAVLCADPLGSCHGSTGPASLSPDSGKPYAASFPLVTCGDTARAITLLLDSLGVEKAACSIGLSFGGMVSLALAKEAGRLAKICTVCTPGMSHPQTIAWRYAQRELIRRDQAWRGGDYYWSPVENGMRLSRVLGFSTLRSIEEWMHRFGHQRSSHDGYPSIVRADFSVEEYVQHQGEKWAKTKPRDVEDELEHTVIDPNSYLYLSRAMDLFSLAPSDSHLSGEEAIAEGARGTDLSKISSLLVAASSDLLHPPWMVEQLANGLRIAGNSGVVFYELIGESGHDTFLKDQQALAPALRGHLQFSE